MENMNYHECKKEYMMKKNKSKHYSMRGPHDYDRSMKHREKESEGMEKYYRERSDGR